MKKLFSLLSLLSLVLVGCSSANIDKNPKHFNVSKDLNDVEVSRLVISKDVELLEINDNILEEAASGVYVKMQPGEYKVKVNEKSLGVSSTINPGYEALVTLKAGKIYYLYNDSKIIKKGKSSSYERKVALKELNENEFSKLLGDVQNNSKNEKEKEKNIIRLN